MSEIIGPSDVILDFLRGLPITIREWVLSMCLLAFDAHPMGPDDKPDYFLLIEKLMTSDVEVFEAYRCAMVAAVIETALVDRGFDEQKFYEGLNEKSPSPLFAKMAVQAPLKERHLIAAREKFAELREGPLSPPALRAWSDYLLASKWRRP